MNRLSALDALFLYVETPEDADACGERDDLQAVVA